MSDMTEAELIAANEKLKQRQAELKERKKEAPDYIRQSLENMGLNSEQILQQAETVDILALQEVPDDEDFISRLPFWPGNASAIPNVISCSDLFYPYNLRGKQRKHFENDLRATRQGTTIYYTGPQLNMADCDVWIELLNSIQVFQKKNPRFFLGGTEPVRVMRRQFIISCGRPDAKGEDYKQVEQTLRRLKSGTVSIDSKFLQDNISLVSDWRIDRASGEYLFWISPLMAKLFSNNAFGFIDMDKRAKLDERSKAWQNYISAYSGRVQVKTDTIMELMHINKKNEKPGDFKKRAMKEDLALLKKNRIIRAWSFKEGEKRGDNGTFILFPVRIKGKKK